LVAESGLDYIIVGNITESQMEEKVIILSSCQMSVWELSGSHLETTGNWDNFGKRNGC
jgi:hypothetical protein